MVGIKPLRKLWDEFSNACLLKIAGESGCTEGAEDSRYCVGAVLYANQILSGESLGELAQQATREDMDRADRSAVHCTLCILKMLALLRILDSQ